MNITDGIVLIAIWAGARLATTAIEHWLSRRRMMHAEKLMSGEADRFMQRLSNMQPMPRADRRAN